jgi:hypothetical protein
MGVLLSRPQNPMQVKSSGLTHSRPVLAFFDGSVTATSLPPGSQLPTKHRVRELASWGFAICGRHHGRQNAAKRQDTEESLPAWIAAVSGKP